MRSNKNKNLPATHAGKRRYKYTNELSSFHSKYIPTFKSQKFKNNGKINELNVHNNNILHLYSAGIKANYKEDEERFLNRLVGRDCNSTWSHCYLKLGNRNDDCIIRCNTYCGPTTEKLNGDVLLKAVISILFIANLPHLFKLNDCIIRCNKQGMEYCGPTTEKHIIITHSKTNIKEYFANNLPRTKNRREVNDPLSTSKKPTTKNNTDAGVPFQAVAGAPSQDRIWDMIAGEINETQRYRRAIRDNNEICGVKKENSRGKKGRMMGEYMGVYLFKQ